MMTHGDAVDEKQAPADMAVLSRLGITSQARVLLLGTFHFDYPGLDAYVPEDQIDILSDHRQAEVAEVVRLLSRFEPTRIAVERRMDREAELNGEYEAYLRGSFELPRSEVYQIGFRVARMCGHRQLYPVDEWGRLYDPWEQVMERCVRLLGLPEKERSKEDLRDIWYRAMSSDRMAALTDMLREKDSLLMTETLREHLLRENSPGAVSFGHGAYLSWMDAPAGDYTAADHVTGWWYNRNLRIFSNLKRLAQSGADRILAIIGSGHLPILRHAVECSWDLELVEVETYLSD